MNADTFPIEFPYTAARMHIGFCTTIEYQGSVYTFRKVAPNQFEAIL